MALRIPPPLWALVIGVLMWVLARAMPDLLVAWRGLDVIAIGLAATGLGIEALCVMAFLRRRTTISPLRPDRSAALVTEGLYAMTRNPMYLGMAMLLTGWALWLGHPLALFGPAVFVLVLTELQIKPEERALEEIFGEEFRAYRDRVPRWL